MKLGRRSGLPDVAVAVAGALAAAGIKAVLGGGAVASLYTGGRYQSLDLDFILAGPVTRARLDEALASVGLCRRGDHYEHPKTRFLVEFPVGPLAIGADYRIRPVIHRLRRGAVRALSPTDSCRDRLAAFFHWQDRQSFRTAVLIARCRQVNMRKIRAWSLKEGFPAEFDEFRREANRRPLPGGPRSPGAR